MSAINGYQHDGRTSPRKRGKSARWACPYGQINWFKKSFVSFLRHTTNLNSPNIRMASAQDVDAIRHSEKSTINGKQRHGFLRERFRTVLINSAMSYSYRH